MKAACVRGLRRSFEHHTPLKDRVIVLPRRRLNSTSIIWLYFEGDVSLMLSWTVALEGFPAVLQEVKSEVWISRTVGTSRAIQYWTSFFFFFSSHFELQAGRAFTQISLNWRDFNWIIIPSQNFLHFPFHPRQHFIRDSLIPLLQCRIHPAAVCMLEWKPDSWDSRGFTPPHPLPP